MSAALRFLGLVLVGWGASRVLLAEDWPDMAVATAAAEPAPPPIVPTEFPPLELNSAPALADTPPGVSGPGVMPSYPAAYPYYVPYPVAVRASTPTPAPRRVVAEIPPRPALFADRNPNDRGWDLASLASLPLPPARSAPQPVAAQPVPAKLDRVQLSAWALLRDRNGAPSLASGGTLGGSQAGVRLTYAVTPSLAASFRTTNAVGQRGVELAAGIRYRPLHSLPLWVTAERRQAVGGDGGRSAFALFAEGGVYQLAMPWKFELDGYAQAGVVGARSRDLFADGGFTLTRPVYSRYSAGFGMWGGVQPGFHRLDAGPRVSMKVRSNMRVHVDWRQRLSGRAEPGSGPAVTLAADF